MKYSEDVFRNNLKYAILGQLQNPPEGFEDVVKAHFFLKRHILLKVISQLLPDFFPLSYLFSKLYHGTAYQRGKYMHFFMPFQELEKMLEKYKSKEVKKQFQDVKRELMKLEQPPNLKKSFQSAE